LIQLWNFANPVSLRKRHYLEVQMSPTKIKTALIVAATLALAGCGSAGTSSQPASLPTTLDAAGCKIVAAPLVEIQRTLAGYGKTSTTAVISKALAVGSDTWLAQSRLYSGAPATWLKSLTDSANSLRTKLVSTNKTGLAALITAFAVNLQKFPTFCP
jgi:hypothetical protein